MTTRKSRNTATATAPEVEVSQIQLSLGRLADAALAKDAAGLNEGARKAAHESAKEAAMHVLNERYDFPWFANPKDLSDQEKTIVKAIQKENSAAWATPERVSALRTLRVMEAGYDITEDGLLQSESTGECLSEELSAMMLNGGVEQPLSIQKAKKDIQSRASTEWGRLKTFAKNYGKEPEEKTELEKALAKFKSFLKAAHKEDAPELLVENIGLINQLADELNVTVE